MAIFTMAPSEVSEREGKALRRTAHGKRNRRSGYHRTRLWCRPLRGSHEEPAVAGRMFLHMELLGYLKMRAVPQVIILKLILRCRLTDTQAVTTWMHWAGFNTYYPSMNDITAMNTDIDPERWEVSCLPLGLVRRHQRSKAYRVLCRRNIDGDISVPALPHTPAPLGWVIGLPNRGRLRLSESASIRGLGANFDPGKTGRFQRLRALVHATTLSNASSE